MTWRIQERDQLAVVVNLVGTDCLRDPTGFRIRNVGMTNLIQKRRLTVVNVTHNRNDWWSRYHVFRILVFLIKEFVQVGNVFLNLFLSFDPIISGQKLNRVRIQGLVLVDHDAKHEQLLDDFSCWTVQKLSQILRVHAFRVFKNIWQWTILTLSWLLLFHFAHPLILVVLVVFIATVLLVVLVFVENVNATAIVIIAATVVVTVTIVVLRLLTVLRTAVVFWALWLFLLWLAGLGSGWLIGTLGHAAQTVGFF